jgi:hypothetical protein
MYTAGRKRSRGDPASGAPISVAAGLVPAVVLANLMVQTRLDSSASGHKGRGYELKAAARAVTT